jgi:translation initiation factor 6
VFKRLDPFGNPNVGVYVHATSSHLFLPPGLTDENVTDLEEALGLPSIRLTLGGSTLLGSLMACNKHGAVVADFVNQDEIQVLKDAGLEVARLRNARLNAAGNNILCNDKGAIAHPDLNKAQLQDAADALNVEIAWGSMGGVETVGMAGVATNRGILVHPLTTDDERIFIKDCLHAPVRIGTVNHGTGLVGAGVAANPKGFACGSRTTGIELGRIDEALGFLEDENE